jgi:hypothetical protein
MPFNPKLHRQALDAAHYANMLLPQDEIDRRVAQEWGDTERLPELRPPRVERCQRHRREYPVVTGHPHVDCPGCYAEIERQADAIFAGEEQRADAHRRMQTDLSDSLTVEPRQPLPYLDDAPPRPQDWPTPHCPLPEPDRGEGSFERTRDAEIGFCFVLGSAVLLLAVVLFCLKISDNNRKLDAYARQALSQESQGGK